jgi:hypothetical protein
MGAIRSLTFAPLTSCGRIRRSGRAAGGTRVCAPLLPGLGRKGPAVRIAGNANDHQTIAKDRACRIYKQADPKCRYVCPV